MKLVIILLSVISVILFSSMVVHYFMTEEGDTLSSGEISIIFALVFVAVLGARLIKEIVVNK